MRTSVDEFPGSDAEGKRCDDRFEPNRTAGADACGRLWLGRVLS